MSTQPQPNHDELVEVFDTQEESEAFMVRGLLESAGIPALITAWDAPQDVLPGVGGVILEVRAEQAEQALRLIEEHRNNASNDPELTEEASQPE